MRAMADPIAPLEIPPFLRRAKSTTRPRQVNPEVEERRRVHKLAMECQRWQEKAKREKAARHRKSKRATTKE